MRPHIVLSLALSLTPVAMQACGGSPQPPASPEAPGPQASASAGGSTAPASSSSAQAEAKPALEAFPSKCHTVGDLCTLGDEQTERVCKLQSADVALALFAKSRPFTRGYLTRDTDAWNASGGGMSRDKLRFDEEVLVLRKRAASSIIVGQGGGYDVLRWDGSCASLAAEELTTKKPPKPRNATVSWKELDGKTRDALTADSKVGAAQEKRRKECKGATSGDVTAACEKAHKALGEAIVEFVRSGGQVPEPKLP